MFFFYMLFCFVLIWDLNVSIVESMNVSVLTLFLLISYVYCELNEHNKKLSWLVGKWRSEFSGKIVWPTVPTMTYGEELTILEAPQGN